MWRSNRMTAQNACRSPSSSANATTASSARLGARMPSRFTASQRAKSSPEDSALSSAGTARDPACSRRRRNGARAAWPVAASNAATRRLGLAPAGGGPAIGRCDRVLRTTARRRIGRCWPLQEGPSAVFRGMQRPLKATGLPPRIGPMLAKPSDFLLPSPWLTARRTPAPPRAGTRARAPRSAGRARRPRPAAGRWSTRPSHAGG